MKGESERFFEEMFAKICGGREAYPWQRQLFLDMISGSWPEVIPLPTGSGKTSVMHVWLLALAWSLRTGEAGIPRRLAWVVNRRVVVDQVSQEAAELATEGGALEQCPEVYEPLRRVSATGKALAISTLRGQRADDGAWADDPSCAAIAVGTVDMIGSRLLFRGYGAGRYFRPVHAGLLGVDTLIVNDEAHLSPAFAQLLEQLNGFGPAKGIEGKSFRVVMLSATSAQSGLRVFDHSLEEDVAESEGFRRVFAAPKSLTLHESESRNVEPTLFELATRNPAPRTLVFIERPEYAAEFKNRLKKDGREVKLMTGTMRGLERDALADDPVFKRFLTAAKPESPVWLVATSAAEVGVNLTCERLVTTLQEADHLLQRFGRLNRFGAAEGEAHVVYSTPKEDRLVRTLEYLRSLDGDVSCRNVWAHPAPEDARSKQPAYARLEQRLIECWAQTTYRDRDVSPVASWLQGKEDRQAPETEVAWRADVDTLAKFQIGSEELADVLQRYPVRPRERLREPAERVLEKLEKLTDTLGETADAYSTIVVDSDGTAEIVKLRELLKQNIGYKMVILPDRLGRLDDGMFRPGIEPDGTSLDVADAGSNRHRFLVEDGVWTPVGGSDSGGPFERPDDKRAIEEYAADGKLRAPLIVRGPEGSGKLLYFAEAPPSKRGLRDVFLDEHTDQVAAMAGELARRVGLEPFAEVFSRAGMLHDRGKASEVWQRAFGGNTEKPIAKSKLPVNVRLLDGYRHELGSLVRVSGDEDDLVLHLVASHHAGARPYFEEQQFDRDRVKQSREMALEAARRYARLQRRYGPWGLAYLEAVFKRADGMVSAGEGGAVSE